MKEEKFVNGVFPEMWMEAFEYETIMKWTKKLVNMTKSIVERRFREKGALRLEEGRDEKGLNRRKERE